MKIENQTIIFKSTLENFIKEESGWKNNTVRRFSDWQELRGFLQFVSEWDSGRKNKWIKIINDVEMDSFERLITDITPFEGYWIISWAVK